MSLQYCVRKKAQTKNVTKTRSINLGDKIRDVNLLSCSSTSNHKRFSSSRKVWEIVNALYHGFDKLT